MNDMKKRIFTFIMTSAIGLLVCAGQMSDEKQILHRRQLWHLYGKVQIFGVTVQR
mgnify:CR=1 FL=1